MFSTRTAFHRNRPAIVDLNLQRGGGTVLSAAFEAWTTMTRTLDQLGIPAFYMDHRVWQHIVDSVPAMMGMSQADIDKLPPYVQHYKCSDNDVERGEPGCAYNKFTPIDDPKCNLIKERGRWHPGW